MSQKEMMRAMLDGKVLEYAGSGGRAWCDKSKPKGQQFRFCSDVVEEEPLTAGWKWPDWQIRAEETE